MSTGAARPAPFAVPRPGIVKALGILNIVISSLTGICLSTSFAWLAMMATGRAEVPVEVRVESRGGPQPTVAVGIQPPVSPGSANWMMAGMSDPNFVRFTWVDGVTGLTLNALMFATGIGLVNLRPWAARWWTWVAWAKLVRLFLLWGFFIVVVSPTLSDLMARSFFEMVKVAPNARGRMPSMGDMKRIYATMNLIIGVSVILVGSIYPALSLWLIGRPGARAALGPVVPKGPYHP